MTEAAIVGASMTRFGTFAASTTRSLAEEAVAEALADAGLAASEVQTIFFGNGAAGILTGQEMIRGQSALRHTGLLGRPIVNVENACASASTAFQLAAAAVESGAVEVALAVGAEKLTHEDKRKSFAAIGTAADLAQLDDFLRAAEEVGMDVAEAGSKGSLFMDIYAANTRRYMADSEATAADFAAVAVKNRAHAALNPKAQFRKPITVEEVLAGRMVSDPLTLLMCSPIGDGAAAVVVCSAERAARLAAQPVRVRGYALVSGTERADGEPPAVTGAATLAYERAGVGPDDVDVIELHDAAAPAELIAYEELGLCGPGEGAALLRSGATGLGGRRTVNSSGGLLSKGHPIGATGIAQLVELTDQLRGRCGHRQAENPRVALAENAGGFLTHDPAAATVTILSN
ncbi:thiolase family protein [Nocardia cyriacigeorgica]|uniref:thiolase family protein n=1 Tax=Nocardia cyriacigeorgica TaxID=135487 RepID=UPI00313D7352